MFQAGVLIDPSTEGGGIAFHSFVFVVECLSVLLLDVVDRADIGLVQGRRGLCLAPEPGDCMRVPSYAVRQEFQRNKTVEPGILRLVNRSHPAPTEVCDHAVVRDGLADHCWLIAVGEIC